MVKNVHHASTKGETEIQTHLSPNQTQESKHQTVQKIIRSPRSPASVGPGGAATTYTNFSTQKKHVQRQQKHTSFVE